MICLLQNVRLNYRIFQLFLKNEIFLLQGFQRIEISRCNMLSQKDFTESATSQSRYHIKTWETYFAIGYLVKLIGELLFFRKRLWTSFLFSVVRILTFFVFILVLLILRFLAVLRTWIVVFTVLCYRHQSIGLILTVISWILTSARNCALSASDTHIENVFFYLFWHCLNLLLDILDYELILFYLRD